METANERRARRSPMSYAVCAPSDLNANGCASAHVVATQPLSSGLPENAPVDRLRNPNQVVRLINGKGSAARLVEVVKTGRRAYLLERCIVDARAEPLKVVTMSDTSRSIELQHDVTCDSVLRVHRDFTINAIVGADGSFPGK
jgi:hypothetical protein